MLLHNYLQRKSDIISKAKAEIHNLMTEITDPKIKAAVDDWQPGDPIVDNYPQVDEKKEQADAGGNAGAVEAKANPVEDKKVADGKTDAAIPGATNEPAKEQQEPAAGNAPA